MSKHIRKNLSDNLKLNIMVSLMSDFQEALELSGDEYDHDDGQNIDRLLKLIASLDVNISNLNRIRLETQRLLRVNINEVI